MYFNEKSNNTNVDSEFDKTNPFFDIKNTPKPLLIFIGVGGLILLIIIILLLIPRNNKTEYFLDLNGDTDIIVYSGNEYIENGYSAYDSEGNYYNDEVIVDSNIDYSKSGEYSIIYKFKDIEKKRIITVVTSDKIKTLLVLNGSNPMIVSLNSYYDDPGVTVIDSNYTSEQMGKKVNKKSNVDTSKVGNYKVIYSLVNDAGVTFNLERIVIVTDEVFNIYYSPSDNTQGNVTISGTVLTSDFDYILLPDGTKTTDKKFNYDVNINGTYNFSLFDKSGNFIEKSVDINNIDNEKPTGYCMAIVSSNTEVRVNSSEIVTYNYDIDGDSSGFINEDTFSYSKKANIVSVELKDAAGNVSKIYCDSKVYVDDSYYFTNSLKVKAKDLAKYISNYSQAQIVTFTAGKISDSYSSGINNNTSMYISSGTKSILGIVAAKMQEDGIIKLDTKIDTYWHNLSNYNFNSCTAEWRSMLGSGDSLRNYASKNLVQSGATLRNALTNSSGLYNMNMVHLIPNNDSSEYFGGGLGKSYSTAAFMLSHTYGQLFESSSAGNSTDYNYQRDGLTRESTLAGTTMQIAMKQSLNEYIRSSILGKINAQSNPHFKGGNTIYLGTTFAISAVDYAKIIAAVANDGVYNDTRLFANDTVNEIEKVYSNLKNQTIAFDYINGKYVKYGNFIDVNYFKNYNIGDLSNYYSYVSYNPKTSSGFVAIVKFNTNNNLSMFNSMSNYFYSNYFKEVNMYFNDSSKETNVDKEFKEKKINLFNNLDLKKVIIGGAICLVLLIVVFLLLFRKKTEYFLDLNGSTDLVLSIGSKYVEEGFKAYDSKGNTYDNGDVILEGNVNTNYVGEYILSYTFKDVTQKRIVNIVQEHDKKTILGLIGDSIIFVPLNSTYDEPGYFAMDSDYNSEEIKKMVTKESNVDTSKVGTYKVRYTLVNSMNVTLVRERIVVVTTADFNLDYDTKDLTNNSVKIYGLITNNYFDYILLPDGKKEKNRNFSYSVTENGSYKFQVFLKDGTSHEETIVISNIDLVKPTGYCMAEVDGNTTVKVYANDENGIAAYNYYLDDYKSGYISDDSLVYENSAGKVNVEVQDKAGNVYNMTCSIKEIIRPASSAKPSSSSKKVTTTTNNSGSGTGTYTAPSNLISCNGDRTKYNSDLLNIVNTYGKRKRATAARIAKYISEDIGYRIPYFWAGGHWHYEWDGYTDREKFRGVSPQWGCITKNYREYNGTDMLPAGFDCTGFIAWVLFNAGFTYDEIGTFSGNPVRTFLGKKTLTVIDFAGSTGKIQAGDIVWRDGHMGLVTNISGNIATIAHAKGTAYGLVVEKYNTDTGKHTNGTASFVKVSLMGNYYEG